MVQCLNTAGPAGVIDLDTLAGIDAD